MTYENESRGIDYPDFPKLAIPAYNTKGFSYFSQLPLCEAPLLKALSFLQNKSRVNVAETAALCLCGYDNCGPNASADAALVWTTAPASARQQQSVPLERWLQAHSIFA
jgi:hypothetical protein